MNRLASTMLSAGTLVLCCTHCYYCRASESTLKRLTPLHPHIRLARLATYDAEEVQHPYMSLRSPFFSRRALYNSSLQPVHTRTSLPPGYPERPSMGCFHHKGPLKTNPSIT